MAKCEICKKRWIFSKTVKCDCHKKRIVTHTDYGTARMALLSDPSQYPQRDPDPHLQYYSTIVLRDIETKTEDCSEERFRVQYIQETSHHSSHDSHSSCDSSGWSSGSSDSGSSYDSGSSSSSSDSW